MRIGRFADPEGAAFWALIDVEAETIRRIDGGITEWAASAAAEDTGGLKPCTNPNRCNRCGHWRPLDPGARVFGVGANYLAHLQKLGVTEPPANPTAFTKPELSVDAPRRHYPVPPDHRPTGLAEVELVVVLGGAASEPLLGFTIGNDVSARDAKGLGGLDLFSMKCLDDNLTGRAVDRHARRARRHTSAAARHQTSRQWRGAPGRQHPRDGVVGRGDLGLRRRTGEAALR